MLKEILQAPLNFILPRLCIICGKPLDGVDFICRDCKTKLEVSLIKMPFCQRCGGPMETSCRRCRKDLAFDKARGAFVYEGVAKDLISLYKYSSYTKIARFLANYMTGRLDDFGQIDFITYIPLHPLKKRIRGFSQTEKLARELSKLTGIPVKKTLERVKNTRSQTSLNLELRRENVKNAFEVFDPQNWKGETVILVDDVMTTGFTLSEAAKILKKAGVRKVYCLVAAIGKI